MALSSQEWAFVFGLLGNVISFGVFLSPLPTFYKIYKKKSTQGFQSIPYIVALFSSMLWVYYAFLKPNTTLLITINSFGCFIETIYIGFYLYYATKQARIETTKMVVLLIGSGYGLIVLLTYFLAKGASRAYIIGWICLVLSLCVFVAPLGIVRQVIKTKSVEYMPFSLSAFLTLSAVVWFFYGLLMKDINIALPNVLGFIFGVLQMVLYKIYSKPNKAPKEQKLPETLAEQIVIMGDQKPTAKTDEITHDTAKDGAAQKIPVLLCGIEDAVEAPKEHIVEMGQQPTIAVTA